MPVLPHKGQERRKPEAISLLSTEGDRGISAIQSVGRARVDPFRVRAARRVLCTAGIASGTLAFHGCRPALIASLHPLFFASLRLRVFALNASVCPTQRRLL